MLSIPIIKLEDLVNADEGVKPWGFAPKLLVRRYFLYTLLDYVNERNFSSTMADVWRRMCYARNIQEGAKLREICIVGSGYPRLYQWEWPIFLYLAWWLKIPLNTEEDNFNPLSVIKTPQFKEWKRKTVQVRFEEMKTLLLDPSYANQMEFEWQCQNLGLKSSKVRREHEVQYEKSEIEGKAFILPGSLDWLKSLTT